MSCVACECETRWKTLVCVCFIVNNEAARSLSFVWGQRGLSLREEKEKEATASTSCALFQRMNGSAAASQSPSLHYDNINHREDGENVQFKRCAVSCGVLPDSLTFDVK